ncbi:fibronectin type III domain-containing protein [Desulfogranum japonicum]|uniref:fibronectin type III domain-containing protein n=1 Tax=Desulfogranum japonicum TaxID=231447 RepID=UPI0003FDDE97|nr:fibronectin type III domain-containing protein [Desulfogranum japonicum]
MINTQTKSFWLLQTLYFLTCGAILFILPSISVAGTIQYSYDAMQRVVNVARPDGTQTIRSYDTLGNKLITTVQGGSGIADPPVTPHTPIPVNAATNVPTTTLISWQPETADPSQHLTYILFIGTSETPELYTSGIPSSSFQLPDLNPLTTYYWKVVAKDNFNQETESPTWSFTTGNETPEASAPIFPALESTVVYSNAYLQWQEAIDPNSVDTVTYDVYFGKSGSVALVSENQLTTNYELG